MELKELVGKHTLSGIEVGVTRVKIWNDHEEDGNYIKFTLDEKTYTAVENPDDGYRSFMEDLEEGTEECKIKLPNIEVECFMKPDGSYGLNDVLLFKDIKSNEIILEIGTEDYNDYYPYCVLEYYPEKMYCNRERVKNG